MKVVYTHIFGKWDWLKSPLKVTPGWRYVCFTDTPESVWPKTGGRHTWEIKSVPQEYDTPKRAAGYYLTHGLDLFPDYDIIVSVSGQCHVVGDLDGFVDKFLKRDYCLMRHPARNCTYAEGRAVVSYKKDIPQNVNPQMDRYRAEGLPEHNGMVQTAVIGRRNKPEIREFEEFWWQEIKNESQRDQLSFNYTLWKHPIKVDCFDPNHLGKFVAICPHRK